MVSGDLDDISNNRTPSWWLAENFKIIEKEFELEETKVFLGSTSKNKLKINPYLNFSFVWFSSQVPDTAVRIY